jgi:catechol 2,3-dioxygenase
MPKISKVGHVVLAVHNPETSAKFYADTLGMELVNYYSDPAHGLEMAFLSFGTNHHDIALIKVPQDAPVGNAGFSHTALVIDGGESELAQLYHQLKARGVQVELTADHGVSRSFYLHDPEGNRLEVYYDAMPPGAALEFMRQGRAGMAPYDLGAVQVS